MLTNAFRLTAMLLTMTVLASSCMLLDGSSDRRKKNKCCGIIKCDLHRHSQKSKHKQAVNASRSNRKKEARIKRGY